VNFRLEEQRTTICYFFIVNIRVKHNIRLEELAGCTLVSELKQCVKHKNILLSLVTINHI
jgi:hypothetical protein